MKSLLTLLLLVLCTSVLFAQSNTEKLEELLESGQLSHELMVDLLNSPPPTMFDNPNAFRGKNNNQIERRLDSTTVYNPYANTSTKTQYHYNESGIIDSATSFIHYHDNEDVVPQYLITYRVNNSFQLTEEVFHFWSPGEQSWIEHLTKTEVKYDINGNKTESILRGNSLYLLALVAVSKLNYNYDENNQIISVESHAVYIDIDEFELLNTPYYTSNDSNDFEPVNTAFYNYNSNNDLSKITHTRNPYGMDSIFLETYFLYDSLKRHIETIDYHVSENSDYEISRKFEYFYDENNLNTETTYNRYEDGILESENKSNYFYNDQFLPFEAITYTHDWETNEWVPIDRRTYTLNPDYEVNYLLKIDNYLSHKHHFQAYYDSDMVMPHFLSLPASMIWDLEYEITNENYYVWNQFEWYNYNQTKYYYSDFELPIQASDNVLSINYPNPALGYVSFNTNLDPAKVNVHFFDMAGTEILHSPLPDDKTIHTDNLTTGTYYYQLIDKETKEVLYAGKILKH